MIVPILTVLLAILSARLGNVYLAYACIAVIGYMVVMGKKRLELKLYCSGLALLFITNI